MASNDTIISVVGARPHFVKAFPLTREMTGRKTRHFICHTGQHYDDNMSKIFFDQFQMPLPDVNLNVGAGTHAEQTAKVMLGVEKLVRELSPRAVIVYGDTNSTLAATLAAAKYYFPVVHVEAGVRCWNRRMPEEINRVLIDHASDFLICPSALAVRNLEKEGINKGVLNLGDLMYDSFLAAKAKAMEREDMLSAYQLESGRFILSTIHREATTENVDELVAIIELFSRLDEPVILPIHPRTRSCLERAGAELSPKETGKLRIIDPIGYLEMLQLMVHARKIVTDSGGVQKEAFWAGVPCVTMMDETTWPETIEAGWNVLAGRDCGRILEGIRSAKPKGERPEVYGAPGVARRMVDAMGWS